MEQDKINAYMTLYTALVTVAKAAAPMIPFMTGDIYRNLVCSIDASAPESVHLCDFPEVNEAWIDKELEENMAHLLDIVVMGRACRNTANIKNRQPIGLMYVNASEVLPDYFVEIIKEELNLKNVQFMDNVDALVSYTVKPNFAALKQKDASLIGKIRPVLANADGNAIVSELRKNGFVMMNLGGEDVQITEDLLLIEASKMEGYVSESYADLMVVLDTTLTPELLEEGLLREVISKIQTMRKEAGFEVMDKIRVFVKDNAKIAELLKKYETEILSDVMAEAVVYDTVSGYSKEWNINGEDVTLGVEKI